MTGDRHQGRAVSVETSSGRSAMEQGSFFRFAVDEL